MENKYYTPEIEEFHIGFECEFYHTIGGWRPFEFEMIDFNYVEDNIEEELVRVKYLDREDTESFGFIQGKLPWQAESNIHILIKQREKNQFIIRDKRCDDQVFVGVIKNKSEFKKLLIQLGAYETTTK